MTSTRRLISAAESAAWPQPLNVEASPRWVVIDTAALRDNAAALVRHVGPDVQVMAMVKANGYGHGAVLAARAASVGGASWLGVSGADEALQLRAAAIEAPILVVGWTPPRALPQLIEAGIDVTVFSVAAVDEVAAAATRGRRARVHLKLDTGMGRLGARREHLDAVVAALVRQRHRLEVVGIFSHLADSDADDGFTQQQNSIFSSALAALRGSFPDAIAHLANSGGILRDSRTWHQLVRPGIALYGYPCSPSPTGLVLRPALSMFARVSHLKTVAAGDSVGYGREWVAAAPTLVATVAAGYADGIFRSQGNSGSVVVNRVRCPIIGRVSMDQIGVDVSGATDVRVGDAALIVGHDGNASLGADEVARAGGTVSYEVLTSISARVPRMVLAP